MPEYLIDLIYNHSINLIYEKQSDAQSNLYTKFFQFLFIFLLQPVSLTHSCASL